MAKFAVILAAAGQSSRFGDSTGKKPFVSLQGKPVWLHSAEKFAVRTDVKQLIIVVSQQDESDFRQANQDILQQLDATVIAGGAERVDSVANGIDALKDTIDFVAIHDGARPCVSTELIENVFEAIQTCECVVPALPVNSTVKRSDDGGKTVAQTVDRSQLFLAQTPQVFLRNTIVDLFEKYDSMKAGISFTDEAQIAEHFGVEVRLASGCPLNLKLTRRVDLLVAETYLSHNEGIRFDTPPDDSTHIV